VESPEVVHESQPVGDDEAPQPSPEPELSPEPNPEPSAQPVSDDSFVYTPPPMASSSQPDAEVDPEPAFSHPRATPDDIDEGYDPDAETVMRVKPIDLSHEEDEHDGR
jgi:hypothetical protein